MKQLRQALVNVGQAILPVHMALRATKGDENPEVGVAGGDLES